MTSKKYSPFTALTAREQQERWLEFQNSKLPYIDGEVDSLLSEDTPEWLGRSIEKKAPVSPPSSHASTPPDTALAEKMDAQAFQKTTHRQYDAIIRRMMDAEKQTMSYQAFTPGK